MVHPNSLANLRPAWTHEDAPRPDNSKPRTPPVTAALRKLFDDADESGETNAVKFAKHAMTCAVSGRKDAVLWAKLLLERVDGPVRQEVEHVIGFGAIAARECERWLRRADDEHAA